MNILNLALFAERRLASFFQSLRRRQVEPAQDIQAQNAPAVRTLSGLVIAPAKTARHERAPAVLRVLRVMEPGQQRTSVGRMVISGRMADVCAELDRLAAGEAAMS
jgi:hypothetical protein